MERAMRVMQWLATVALVIAGVMLLVKPMRARAQVGFRVEKGRAVETGSGQALRLRSR